MSANQKASAAPFLLDSRRGCLRPPVMRAMKFTDDDVGKICVINPDKTAGEVITREELLEMDISLVGEWLQISEFDVLDSEFSPD